MKTKMKNHLVKVKNSANLPSVLHSLVYAAIPEGRLMIKDECVNCVLANREVINEIKNKAGAGNIVDDLISRNFLREISGTIIELKLNVT